MKKFTLPLLFLGLSTGAHAHEFLSEIIIQQSTTNDQTYISVGNYQLNKAQIIAIGETGKHIDYYKTREKKLVAVVRDLSDNCKSSGLGEITIGPSTTCGQFDHFSRARSAAVTICYDLAQQSTLLYPDGLVPIFIGPSTFVEYNAAAANHHIDYDLSHGINFDCGYLSTPYVNAK